MLGSSCHPRSILMISKLKAFSSLFTTTTLLIASVIVLHQTHEYSSSRIEESTRLSVLAMLCPILSILCYISPISSVVEMLRHSDDSQFPIAVILAQACQNIASAAYGLQIDNGPFFLSSAVGLMFQVLWLTAWYFVVKMTKSYRSVLVHPALAALLAVLFISCSVYVLTLVSRDYVGVLSCLLTLLLCISPLATLGLVVRSRNSASIPIPMSVVMLATNAAWAVYGILLEDNYVFLPSLFGFVITVFQLIVTAWCGGLLFYDLTFLQWAYGYQSVDGTGVQERSESNRFGLEEGDRSQ